MSQARLQEALARIARAGERIERSLDEPPTRRPSEAAEPAPREVVIQAIAELDALLARLGA